MCAGFARCPLKEGDSGITLTCVNFFELAVDLQTTKLLSRADFRMMYFRCWYTNYDYSRILPQEMSYYRQVGDF